MKNMSRIVIKQIFGNVRRANMQTYLRILAVWSESSLGAFWIAKSAIFHADNGFWSNCVDVQADLSS